MERKFKCEATGRELSAAACVRRRASAAGPVSGAPRPEECAGCGRWPLAAAARAAELGREAAVLRLLLEEGGDGKNKKRRMHG